MKTQFKILILNIFVICLVEKANAQFNWLPNSFPPHPNHDLLQAQTGYFTVMGGTGSLPSTALTGMGINTETPAYILDIVGNYTGDGVNVSSGSNQVGYSIGGNMMLWNNGDIQNIYVGVHAGNANTGIYQNTFVGGNAGINFTRL